MPSTSNLHFSLNSYEVGVLVETNKIRKYMPRSKVKLKCRQSTITSRRYRDIFLPIYIDFWQVVFQLLRGQAQKRTHTWTLRWHAG